LLNQIAAIHGFTPAAVAPTSADYLVVAGGGGGGSGTNGAGGGGGAGGFRTSTALSLGASFTVTVGAGGAGGALGQNRGAVGSNSVFKSITSSGGGGGGVYSGAGTVCTTGGSGGGSYGSDSGTQPGAAGNSGGYSPVEGFAGGSSTFNSGQYHAGGGGGASAVGANGVSNSGGNGGAGTANSYSGSSVTYAGGGGGGGGRDTSGNTLQTGGTGGAGGGGNGATDAGASGAGTTNLGANVITEGQNVLQYIQQVETSELGLFFIAKDGKATFLDRAHQPGLSGFPVFADDGTGIKYQNLQIAYGSENLINEVDATSVITTTLTSGIDSASQTEFGIFNLTLDNLLLSTDAQVATLVTTILDRYSYPIYRFTELEVRLNDLTLAQQTQVLNAELGDYVQVIFTPSNLPPAIIRMAQVIRANHSVDLTGEHIVTLGLNSLDVAYFLVLDDASFGRLDEGSLL